MTTPASAQITPTGIVVPDYATVLAYIQGVFQAIYGADVVVTPNTQDEQFLAILAQLISDNNQLAAAVYNSFFPTFAQGTGLSSLVKINGISRNVPTNSQCVVTLTGVAGTQIINGLVGDNQNLGTQWALPSLVTIPLSGTISVTATATVPGATPAGNNTLTVILTPTLGWQTVTNGTNAPSVGSPTESDAALRARQAQSTGLPAQTPTEAIYANVANVPGVSDLILYNNDTGSPDGNGVPAHSICLVVEGGDALAVATAIFEKKAPGTGTYGSTTETVYDQNGVPDTIHFYELAFTSIWVTITIVPGTGYTSVVGNAIVAAVLAVINSLPIGGDVSFADVLAAATLIGQPGYGTFTVTVAACFIGTAPSPGSQADIAITFNHQASIVTADVVLVT